MGSKEVVRTAYLGLAKTLHPDVNKAADAPQKFQKVREAYETLSDEGKRKEYDRQLGPSPGSSFNGAAAGMGKGQSRAEQWEAYQRMRTGSARAQTPDLRWARQKAEADFRARYQEQFNRAQFQQQFSLSFMRILPVVAPIWMIIFFLTLRGSRKSEPEAGQQAMSILHDDSGRAFIVDAYGR